MLMQMDVDSKTRFARLKAVALRAMARTGGAYEIEIEQETLRRAVEALEPPLEARDALVLGAATPALVQTIAGRFAVERVRVVPGTSDESAARLREHTGVEVVDGDVTDLSLDPEAVSTALTEHPVRSLSQMTALRRDLQRQAASSPWIADDSVDYVVADLQLNLLTRTQGVSCLGELYRVLRSRTGRLEALVLLADEPLADAGSGVRLGKEVRAAWLPTEAEFLDVVAASGLHGTTLQMVSPRPVLVSAGKEVRLWKISAYKGKEGPCWDFGHAVVYRGPWSEVADDDGHRYRRGDRVAVCEKTFRLLGSAPYAGQFDVLHCYAEPEPEAARLFDCNTPAIRKPAVTKGLVPLGRSDGTFPGRGDYASAGCDC